MLFAPARGTISICQDWKQTFPLLCRGTLSLLSKAVLQATRSLLTRSAEMWKTQGELLPNSMKTYSTFEWHWNVIFDYKTTTQKITWSYLTFFREFNSIQCEDSWISRLILFFFLSFCENINSGYRVRTMVPFKTILFWTRTTNILCKFLPNKKHRNCEHEVIYRILCNHRE